MRMNNGRGFDAPSAEAGPGVRPYATPPRSARAARTLSARAATDAAHSIPATDSRHRHRVRAGSGAHARLGPTTPAYTASQHPPWQPPSGSSWPTPKEAPRTDGSSPKGPPRSSEPLGAAAPPLLSSLLAAALLLLTATSSVLGVSRSMAYAMMQFSHTSMIACEYSSNGARLESW